DRTSLRRNAAPARVRCQSEGEGTGKRLAALSLPGLPGELLVEKTATVREEKSEVERSRAILHRGGDRPPVELGVEVSTLRDTGGEISGLVYTVHDLTTFAEMERDLRKSTEERDAALEELQSLNKELQSANEEMQSTNEELETTNEELQSTNAELDATNRELIHRTEEMNSLAFIQRATIRSLNAAVIVVDANGRITMWNLAAERLLGI